MNIIFVGPCGVGKSTTAEFFAKRAGMKYLDFDELRAADNKQKKDGSLPCSVGSLNIMECLAPKLDSISMNFVLDIGGGTVFRPNINNDERLKQIFLLKNIYSAKVVILTAKQEVLFERYINTKSKSTSNKNRTTTHFNNYWLDWLTVEKTYWEQCAELIIDTTSLSVEDTSKRIKDWLMN